MMDKTLLHDTLLNLPLFQGMSRNDLNEVMANTHFLQRSFSKGRAIVSDGDRCDHIHFLVKGSVSATRRAHDNGYQLTETLAAPTILQPERIFGLTQRYTYSFETNTEATLLSLTKADMLTLADSYQIFRLNLLNIISTHSQRLANQAWRTQPNSIHGKILRFVEMHSRRPAGPKTLTITMQRLANEIAESRLNVSRTLNAMHAAGQITLRRNAIHIPALEKLL